MLIEDLKEKRHIKQALAKVEKAFKHLKELGTPEELLGELYDPFYVERIIKDTPRDISYLEELVKAAKERLARGETMR